MSRVAKAFGIAIDEIARIAEVCACGNLDLQESANLSKVIEDWLTENGDETAVHPADLEAGVPKEQCRIIATKIMEHARMIDVRKLLMLQFAITMDAKVKFNQAIHEIARLQGLMSKEQLEAAYKKEEVKPKDDPHVTETFGPLDAEAIPQPDSVVEGAK